MPVITIAGNDTIITDKKREMVEKVSKLLVKHMDCR